MRFQKLHAIGLAVALTLAAGPALSADATKGKKVFNKCKACHSLKKGKKKVGPSLYGVFGRKAGTLKGFKFSKAMKKSGVTWDEKTIDQYLTKPKAFIKGNRMAFRGLKKQSQRDDVIAYLKEAAK